MALRPLTHEWLRGIREVLDGYDGDRVMVGEVNLQDPAQILSHTGLDQLHLAFNFNLLWTSWSATAFRDEVAAIEATAHDTDSWPTLVLSNHDVPRHRTRYGGDERRARVAAVVLLTLRGTPFLYAGEELGLSDAVVPPERRVDPGGRDPARAPIPWNGERMHGWAGDPWLPWPPEPSARNVEAQRRDQGSIAALYRRLLRTRRADPALHAGALELLDAPDGMLAYDRVGETERRRVVANFDDAAATLTLDGDWRVLVATDRRREGAPFDGALDGVEAVVLEPGA